MARRSPRASAIPYDAVAEREDRAWTARVIERLADRATPDDERDVAAQALAAVGDPRAVAPLTALLEDRAAPPGARAAASAVLAEVSNRADEPVEAWWRSGDPALMRHALACVDERHADLVAEVASDPAHPLHADAVAAIGYGFESPRFASLATAALGHRDPAVRAAAAEALEWSAPAAAEAPLIAALADPSQEVAAGAAETLQRYESRRALAAIASLRGSKRAALRAQAEASFERLRGAFGAAAAGTPELRAWLAPVWHLVEDAAREAAARAPSDPTARAPEPPRAPATVDEVRARLAVEDAPWAETKAWFARVAWGAFGAEDRAALAAYLAAHGDPWVREAACGPLALWGARDALLALVDDPHVLVSRTAIYRLGALAPPDPRVAARALRRLDEAGVGGTRAQEALRAYVAHAPRDEAIAALRARVERDHREGVRAEAARALAPLGALDAVRELAPPVLGSPPAVSWDVHVALLDACARLGVAPPPDALAALRDVDRVDVQRALLALERL